MKTILYNPIFINPQAYYVFPRLTRYLQPDNESTAEPANYIGTIEVKVIAYGDTTLKRTYTNTDSIDLSEFKNTWIRISLFTKVGSCVLGEWKIGNMESDLPYIDPEVLASLKAVVIVGNKTNNDSDRAIVKNLVDPDNPFVISNAAYTEGSGYADKDSPYYGAFVTDGINDLITSTKTVQEMLGGSNEITVISMIHQIADRGSTYPNIYNNQIRYSTRLLRSTVTAANVVGKTGIYGYTATGVSITGTPTGKVVNDILGDKNDYPYLASAFTGIDAESHFSVEGYLSDSGNINETSKVAWYWTIIANKVLTTDQINQVIAYFNLDRTLNPDILCNTIKQGITNENHAEFGDKLIDFSGNGRDIQLNNLAWKGDSGIGKYNFSNINIISSNRFEGAVTTNKCHFTKKLTNTTNNFCDLVVISPNEPIKFKVSGLSDGRKLFIANKSGSGSNYNFDNGEHEVSLSFSEGVGQNNPFGVTGDIGDIDVTVEFIPSHAGALHLDGVNDFGKVTGMPVYKDYTIIADYERFYLEPITEGRASILSKSSKVGDGSFIFNLEDQNGGKACYTFGEANGNISDDITRIIRYQSKYYNTKTLSIGTAEDNDFMVLGKVREVDSRYFCGAIYSLMSFPYSMSEFLIERQLKKHKLGTLYPNMVEFRPIVESNVKYQDIIFRNASTGEDLVAGQYYDLEAIAIFIKPNNIDEVSNVRVNNTNAQFRSYDSNSGYYRYDVLINKSPQKINITIDEYIRFEDIVQPYPALLRFNDENGTKVSWGGKFKVGSTITRIGSAADSNLLPNMYNIFGLLLNDNQVTSSKVIVEKTMVFKAKSAYIFDNNEPKCILSPSRLRIPNSSYKLLGYIPDISGHDNHGKINNSAYEGMSGANGYPVVFGENKTWANESNGYVTSITSNTIHITNVLNAGLALLYSYVKYNGNLQNIKEIPPFKIEIKGLEGRSKFIYKYLATSDATKETNLYLGNGTHELPKSFLPTEALINNAVVGFSISPIEEGVTNFLSDITIKVLSEYEGAYCLDGVDDFVTIPTTVGGKQMLMKVNWQKSPTLLYDQRASGSFAVLTTKEDDAVNPRIAYQGRNQNGKTYIDGIENNNIETYTLKDITHNITIANSSLGAIIVPAIGCNTGKTSSFAQMSLYDFMLFDNISTDDKIKELNEYVGIEGNTE